MALEEREKTEGAGALFDELKAKDPEAAARMDPHNPRRTIRALEVIEVTGRPYSASLPHYRYVIPTVQIGLDLPREELDRRIDIRTKQMLEGGFIEEVERIRPKLGITAAKALGYQQVVDYLDGLRDLNDTSMTLVSPERALPVDPLPPDFVLEDAVRAITVMILPMGCAMTWHFLESHVLFW